MVSYRSVQISSRAMCVGLLAMLVEACPASRSEPSKCPAPHATFRLVVDALDGPLPSTTQIIMKTGSGTETFRVEAPEQSPSLLFCKTEQDKAPGSEADGSDGAAAVEDVPIARVLCDLWTDGAATVRATADGYPEVSLNLSAERDECGIVLTEHRLTLEHRD